MAEAAQENGATANAADDNVALLEKYAPLLRYDSQGICRAVAVDSVVLTPGNRLLRGKSYEVGSVVGVRNLDLNELSAQRDSAKDEFLDLAPNPIDAAARFQAHPEYRDRYYGRVVTHRRRRYLQYWLWFYFVPTDPSAAGGRVRGAWRAIHIRLDKHGNPDRVALEGTRPETRKWSATEKTANGRPVFFVTPFALDLLFDKSARDPVSEGCDADGPLISCRFRAFGDWQHWPGRWGSGPGSPRTPSRRASWQRPGALRARAAGYLVFIRVLLWWSYLFPGDTPEPPEIAGRLERERVALRYYLKTYKGLNVTVTVHANGQVVGAERVMNAGQEGSVFIPVPAGTEKCTVRASVIGVLGRRSRIGSTKLRAGAADPFEQRILRSIIDEVVTSREVQEFSTEFGVPDHELRRLDEGRIWTEIATELQEFRDARRDESRLQRSSREAASATRWTWMLGIGSAALALAAVVAPFVLPGWGWVITGTAAYFLIFTTLGITEQWKKRRRAIETKEESGRALRGDSGGTRARETFERAVREKGVAPAIRERLNRKVESGYRRPLWFGDEGLTELRVSDREVDTDAMKRVDALMHRMPDGSIGVAGPRGAGKTTLIRAFAKRRDPSDRRLTVVVDAPAKYDARDFVLALLAELSKRVLREDRPSRRSASFVARFGGRWVALVCGALVVAAGLGTWSASLDKQPELTVPLTIVALAMIAMAATVTIYRWRAPQPERDEADELASQAAEHLEQARYLQSYSEGYSGKLTFPTGVEIGGDKSKTFEEQQRSFPEVVGDLRGFLADAARVRGGVLIGVDELDKMESSEQAQQFLNEIKGIFGVEGCFYLVSISENAMSSFERRGLPLRDVFDSSFDEVVHVSPLTLTKSSELLRGRVIGLGPPFVDLCHVLSGGLPRDLLRVVRKLSLLNLRNERSRNQDGAVAERTASRRNVARVCETLVGQELAEKAKASIVEAQRVQAAEPGHSELLAWMRSLSACKIGTGDLVAAVGKMPRPWMSPDQRSVDAELARVHAELISFVYFLITVVEVFSYRSKDPARYFQRLERGASRGASQIDQLARARAAFEVNPRVAAGLVKQCRADLGLVEIPRAPSAGRTNATGQVNGGSPQRAAEPA